MSQSSSPTKAKILSSAAAKARLKRIAYEVYEANYGNDELVILGIDERGGFLAEQLRKYLTEISPIKTRLILAKKVEDPDGITIESEEAREVIEGKAVLIVDDVLYSGRTLFQTIAAVMELDPVRVQTAVLIDRGHRSIPVTHDFVGMLLSTSLKQHVSVEISPETQSATAYLL